MQKLTGRVIYAEKEFTETLYPPQNQDIVRLNSGYAPNHITEPAWPRTTVSAAVDTPTPGPQALVTATWTTVLRKGHGAITAATCPQN